MTETEPVVVARFEPAYNTQAADIILRAADGTDFRYFKSVLSLASPIFRDMFSLPQPGLSVARPSGSDEPLQILDVHDSAVGLYALLHFCYPALRYEPDTFEAAEGLMTVAHKYCVSEAMEEGWRQIIRFVGKLQPLRAYCVACKLKLGAEARQAAKLVLSLDHTGLLEYQSDLETLSAGDYQRLINYHQRACVAASQVAASNSFLWVDYSRIYWDHAPTASCPQFRTEQEFQAARTGDDRRIAKSVSLWWKTYMDAVGLALAQHPSTAIPKSESFMQLMRDGSAKCDKCRLDIGRAYLWNEFLSEFESEIEKVISAVTLEVKF